MDCAFDETIIASANRSLKSTDDAGCERAIETEGITDSKHFLTHDEFVRVAQGNDSQWAGGFFSQTNDGEIRVGITTDDNGWIIFFTAEAD